MLNLIVWNRTVYMHKNGFSIKKPTIVEMPWNQTKQKQFEKLKYSASLLSHQWKDVRN